jgi:hypothetical protein
MTNEQRPVGYRLTVSVADGFRFGLGLSLAVVIVRLAWRLVALGVDLPRGFLE